MTDPGERGRDEQIVPSRYVEDVEVADCPRRGVDLIVGRVERFDVQLSKRRSQTKQSGVNGQTPTADH